MNAWEHWLPKPLPSSCPFKSVRCAQRQSHQNTAGRPAIFPTCFCSNIWTHPSRFLAGFGGIRVGLGRRLLDCRIPTGFRPPGQGGPGSGTTLGRLTHFYATPTGLCHGAGPANGHNPVGVGGRWGEYPRWLVPRNLGLAGAIPLGLMQQFPNHSNGLLDLQATENSEEPPGHFTFGVRD